MTPPKKKKATPTPTPTPTPRFISEPIKPVAGTFDPRGMSRGEPGLPAQFTWRDTTYNVVEVLEVWKTSTPEGGSGEMYLRRHWYRIATDPHCVMTIYCERQPKSQRGTRQRWWIYTVEDEPTNRSISP